MFGSTEIGEALDVAIITNELDLYNGTPALFEDNVVPLNFDGKKSINFYMAVPFDAALEYKEYEYTINCRAENYTASRNIADIVVTQINRRHYAGYYIIVSVLGTIRPENDLDNYNTPITATIKKR